MKNVFRSIFLATATALLVTSASVPSQAAAQIARASSFDGNWSVVINTLRGDCGSALSRQSAATTKSRGAKLTWNLRGSPMIDIGATLFHLTSQRSAP